MNNARTLPAPVRKADRYTADGTPSDTGEYDAHGHRREDDDWDEPEPIEDEPESYIEARQRMDYELRWERS